MYQWKLAQITNPLQAGQNFTENFDGSLEYKKPFEVSQMSEFNSLIIRGVFTLVSASDSNEYRFYGSQFVSAIKNDEKPAAFEKSRLSVQAYNDSGHGLHTHEHTVQGLSQRLLLTLVLWIAVCLSSLVTFRRLYAV